MHIIIAILGALAAAFFAFRYFVDAADQGREAIGDARGAVRRGKWSRRIDKRLVENLSDPREAAAVLLFQIASYDGAFTDAQKSAVLGEMQNEFSVDEETAEGLFAFARMAVGEINDASNSLSKIVAPIQATCSDDEKRSFIEMLKRMAVFDGPTSDIQTRLINAVELKLLPS